jgi:hypothetical protein
MLIELGTKIYIFFIREPRVMNAELTDERCMGSLLAFECLLPSSSFSLLSSHAFLGRND